MKDRFLEIFRNQVTRRGADKLLEWLESTDFFIAPASTRFHAAYEGGLLEHSLNVYNVLIAKHCRSTSSVFSAAFRLNRKEEVAQRAEVEELLEIVGLSDLKEEPASSLPYGKQRRLEIARALATKPKLLLLDEPAAGMNPQETEELTAFIGEIREKFGSTIFLIEHHMNLVMDISDRIYVLDFGKLIASGTPVEIQKNQRVIDAYLGVTDDA